MTKEPNPEPRWLDIWLDVALGVVAVLSVYALVDNGGAGTDKAQGRAGAAITFTIALGAFAARRPVR